VLFRKPLRIYIYNYIEVPLCICSFLCRSGTIACPTTPLPLRVVGSNVMSRLGGSSTLACLGGSSALSCPTTSLPLRGSSTLACLGGSSALSCPTTSLPLRVVNVMSRLGSSRNIACLGGSSALSCPTTSLVLRVVGSNVLPSLGRIFINFVRGALFSFFQRRFRYSFLYSIEYVFM
jgi:hypothetical protein